MGDLMIGDYYYTSELFVSLSVQRVQTLAGPWKVSISPFSICFFRNVFTLRGNSCPFYTFQVPGLETLTQGKRCKVCRLPFFSPLFLYPFCLFLQRNYNPHRPVVASIFLKSEKAQNTKREKR